MRIAGIQCDLAWEDPAANRAALAPRIDEAAAEGARLVVLPEMWPTGFSMAPEQVAEPEGGPSETFLLDTARRLGVAICGSIAQQRTGDQRARNVAVLALPDGSVHRYAKIHPFSFGGETRHYAGGDALLSVQFEGVRVTPLVCYDLRFPELWAAAASRTDLFLLMANWPTTRAAHWTTLLDARAIETQAYVLGVNRVGTGGGLHYSGLSALVGPFGEVVASARDRPAESAVVAGDVDPARVAQVRRDFPFLADRRPELYRRLV